jgi:predicted XRE-type DNA-binding protein
LGEQTWFTVKNTVCIGGILPFPADLAERSRDGQWTRTVVDATRGPDSCKSQLEVKKRSKRLVKAGLVQHIRKLLSERKITQTQAARLHGLDQPKVSLLVRGQVQGYSIDRLFRFLTALGQQVEISVRPAGSATAVAGK